MKQTFVVILLFLISFNYDHTKADVVYIDINYILNKSEIGKSLNNYIKGINDKNTQKYKKIESDLINKEKSILAKQNIIEKVEFEKIVSQLSKEVQKYRFDQKSSNEELNKIKIDYTKNILEYLNPIITNYVEKNSISLVIPKKNIIIGKKKLDITEEIIEILNKQVKTFDFK
tara:strand:- start:348 stop:866 length:519 start_codon:yes stop_codon:yes gene_type:complete